MPAPTCGALPYPTQSVFGGVVSVWRGGLEYSTNVGRGSRWKLGFENALPDVSEARHARGEHVELEVDLARALHPHALARVALGRVPTARVTKRS